MGAILRNLRIQMAGAVDRFRISVGSRLMVLGADLASAFIGLGLAIAPELRVSKATPRASPWGAVAVVVLLILGALTVGEGGMWIIEQAVPHREYRP